MSAIFQQLLLQQLAPFVVTGVYSIAGSYFRARPSSPTVIAIGPEQEVQRLQMDRLLKWMEMMFDETVDSTSVTPVAEPSPYRQELYSLFKGIRSDYHEYVRWKRYNDDLWIMTSYRKKNLKPLAEKILADVALFREGLQMFSGRM
jgi:hypothetical protein